MKAKIYVTWQIAILFLRLSPSNLKHANYPFLKKTFREVLKFLTPDFKIGLVITILTVRIKKVYYANFGEIFHEKIR